MAVVGGSLCPLLDELKGPLMKRLMKSVTTALVALATLCAAVPSFAKEQVPFHYSHEGSFALSSPTRVEVVSGVPYFVVNVITRAEGTGSHLGRYVFELQSEAYVHVIPPYVGAYITGGKGRFIAANGDELWFEGSGGLSGNVQIQDPPLRVLHWAPTPFRFIGGTGRFQGTTGSFIADILTDSNLQLISSGVGTIKTVGASKK